MLLWPLNARSVPPHQPPPFTPRAWYTAKSLNRSKIFFCSMKPLNGLTARPLVTTKPSQSTKLINLFLYCQRRATLTAPRTWLKTLTLLLTTLHALTLTLT